MTALQRITRDTTGGHSALYLYYQEGAAVARTIDVTESGSVALDVDADGNTVGVELVNPGPAELEALARIARERELSLEGLFSLP